MKRSILAGNDDDRGRAFHNFRGRLSMLKTREGVEDSKSLVVYSSITDRHLCRMYLAVKTPLQQASHSACLHPDSLIEDHGSTKIVYLWFVSYIYLYLWISIGFMYTQRCSDSSLQLVCPSCSIRNWRWTVTFENHMFKIHVRTSKISFQNDQPFRVRNI